MKDFTQQSSIYATTYIDLINQALQRRVKVVTFKGKPPVNFSVNTFPDGQIQLVMNRNAINEKLDIYVSVTNSVELDIFLQLKRLFKDSDQRVFIKYYYGSRCDKDMDETLGSRVADLLSGARGYSPSVLFSHHESYLNPDPMEKLIIHNLPWDNYSTILFPDESSQRRFKLYESYFKDKSVIVCPKARNQATGEIVAHAVPSLSNQKVLVLDDLCDGGRTFLNIVETVDANKTNVVDLFVMHGIFSNEENLEKLCEGYNHIYTTNSYWGRNVRSFRPELTMFDVWGDE